MNRTKSVLAGGLSAALAFSGCATTHLGGAYRTAANEVSSKQDMRTLDEGSCVPLFWGLFTAGSYDAKKELGKKLRPDEEVTNLEVKERLSVGGFFLWLITAGLVSHHTIEIRGHTAVVSRPPAEPATGAVPSQPAPPIRERERTIVTPAEPQPAGAERSRIIDRERDVPQTPTGPAPQKANKSADYNEGYREGFRDQGRVVITGDGPTKPERSADYNEGYRDGLRGR